MRISDWSSDVCSSDLLPVLVLPFAGLELAFDIDLAALAQIAFGHIGKTFAEDRDRMPFGLFLALAGVAVLPRFGRGDAQIDHLAATRSEEHTSELQSLMRISYAVFCLKKKIKHLKLQHYTHLHH